MRGIYDCQPGGDDQVYGPPVVDLLKYLHFVLVIHSVLKHFFYFLNFTISTIYKVYRLLKQENSVSAFHVLNLKPNIVWGS